ncbi:uncharacterized protein LOC134821539 [Bolinopsis microptera]|uniref:uncharacterized protein LOC134821539 n=1 Tax=Bolinopsis microptera TaxID=2820187 RepID=UPI00307A5263
MIRRTVLSPHLRQIVENRVCSRNATNVRMSDVVKKVLRYNPVSWMYRYLSPGPIPKPVSEREKRLLRGSRFRSFFVMPAFFSSFGVLFYYEWKDRQELLEIKEITYDRRKQMSVDRYNAATGQTKWDKNKYAKCTEGDQARAGQEAAGITVEDNIAVQVSGEVKEVRKKKKKMKSVKELYEAGDNDQPPTLIGQIRGT